MKVRTVLPIAVIVLAIAILLASLLVIAKKNAEIEELRRKVGCMLEAYTALERDLGEVRAQNVELKEALSRESGRNRHKPATQDGEAKKEAGGAR